MTWFKHIASSRQRVRCLSGLTIVSLLSLTLVSGCSQPSPQFTIIAGSENQSLEPIVTEFCAAQGKRCKIVYNGSIDIALALGGSAPLDADAVWPAASLWIDVYDTGRRLKLVQSIAQLPLILGVRRSKAEELKWIGKPVSTQEILKAVEGRRLKFLMTSATQSNSGAAAYIAMLASALGATADPMTTGDLDKERVRSQVKTLLAGVERSAGSSGWLAELYVEGERAGAAAGTRFDAMWNYEATIKETNDALAATGGEPLYAIYPADGVSVADSPLGFLERGRGPDVEAFFVGLQAHLLSPPIQRRIAQTGRRMSLGGRSPLAADARTNLDPNRPLNVVQTPEPTVIKKALALYQEALRKPSLTAMCLDVSGSMKGIGERQLLDAMTALLTPQTAREYLIQWSPQDQIIVLPFESRVRWVAKSTGNEREQADLLHHVLQLRAEGGTDFYTCVSQAMELMTPHLKAGTHLPAIVIMTDGKGDGSMQQFELRWRADPNRVPVFGVTFGTGVDRRQLDDLARLTGGRVFDGTKSLADAFRTLRGYN